MRTMLLVILMVPAADSADCGEKNKVALEGLEGRLVRGEDLGCAANRLRRSLPLTNDGRLGIDSFKTKPDIKRIS